VSSFIFSPPSAWDNIDIRYWLQHQRGVERTDNGIMWLGRKYRQVNDLLFVEEPSNKITPKIFRPIDLMAMQHGGDYTNALRDWIRKSGQEVPAPGSELDVQLHSFGKYLQDTRALYLQTIDILRGIDRCTHYNLFTLTKDSGDRHDYFGKVGEADGATLQGVLGDKCPRNISEDVHYLVSPYFNKPGQVSGFRIWGGFDLEPKFVEIIPSALHLFGIQGGFGKGKLRLFHKEEHACKFKGKELACCAYLSGSTSISNHTWGPVTICADEIPIGVVIGVSNHFQKCWVSYRELPENMKTEFWPWIWSRLWKAWPITSKRPKERNVVEICLGQSHVRNWVLQCLERNNSKQRIKQIKDMFPFTRYWAVPGGSIEEHEDRMYFRRKGGAAGEWLANFAVDVSKVIYFEDGEAHYRLSFNTENKSIQLTMDSTALNRPKEFEKRIQAAGHSNRMQLVIGQHALIRHIQYLIKAKAVNVPIINGYAHLGQEERTNTFVSTFGIFGPNASREVILKTGDPGIAKFEILPNIPKKKPDLPEMVPLRYMVAQTVGLFVSARCGIPVEPVLWKNDPRTVTYALALFNRLGQRLQIHDPSRKLGESLANYPVLTQSGGPSESLALWRQFKYQARLDERGERIEIPAVTSEQREKAAEYCLWVLYQILRKYSTDELRPIASSRKDAAAIGRATIKRFADKNFHDIKSTTSMQALFESLSSDDIYSCSRIDFAKQEVVIETAGFPWIREELESDLQEAGTTFSLLGSLLRVHVQTFNNNAIFNMGTVFQLASIDSSAPAVVELTQPGTEASL
jgi:hypothetical protein